MKSLFLLIFLCSHVPLHAAVTIHYGNIGGGRLRDSNGVLLTMGGKRLGDGAIIQIGYYSLGTLSNPFAGDWIPLIGAGTSVAASTIGDGVGVGLGDGKFAGTAILGSDSISTFSPVQRTPFVIRFYDGTSLETSTHYNALTMGWFWPTSTTTEVNLDMANFEATIVWQGGTGSAYHTTIPYVIPEVSTSMLAVFGCAGILMRRKRFF